MCSIHPQTGTARHGLRESACWSIAPGFLAQWCVQRFTVRSGTGKRDLHEMWKEILQNSPKPSAIFSPRYFRELCQVLDGIEISSAAWTHVHLWFCTTEHLTGVSGHYPCSISKNMTSNITVLTSAESKGDFPLCWLCCYMAKAILQSCLAGILLRGCSPSSEAMLKGIIIRFR